MITLREALMMGLLMSCLQATVSLALWWASYLRGGRRPVTRWYGWWAWFLWALFAQAMGWLS